MVVLGPEKRTLLRGFLRSILHDTVKDAPVELEGAARAAPADFVVGAMDEVLSVVNEALLGFAQEWNATQAGRLVSLPPELVSEIFRQLDFAGRLAVSHVCSSWRRAALADRVLWASYTIPRADRDANGPRAEALGAQGAKAKANVLSLLLERSRPMPFSLIADHVPDAVVEVVIAQMSRMEVLTLGSLQTPGRVQRLLELDIPALKSFASHVPLFTDAPLAIPARWANAHIEHLCISGPWLWPAGCVSESLRSLHGTLPEALDGEWRLSDLFPNLTELRVAGTSSQAEANRLDPLPHALTSMLLLPIRNIDYSALFRNCTAPVRRLRISHLHTPASLEELFRLFLRTFSGDCTLSVDFAAMVLSSAQGDTAYEYQINGHVGSWLSWAPPALSSWARVCRLDITLSDLLGLWATLRPGAILPAMRTVHVRAARNLWARVHELENGAPLESPALASVAVSLLFSPMGPNVKQSAPVLSIVAPIVRAFRAPALEDVEIETESTEVIRRDDVSGLVSLTKRVTARNRFLQSVTTWTLPSAEETE